MILPSTEIHVSQKLLPNNLKRLVDEKIRLFKVKKLDSAALDEQVGVITGYKFIYTNDDCGGYCNRASKIIAYNPKWKEKFWMRSTMLHEIGHAIQAEAEVFEKGDYNLISTVLKMEWQVEGIAYRMYNSIYQSEKMPHYKFNAYLTEQDIDWYKKWAWWKQDDTSELNKPLIW